MDYLQTLLKPDGKTPISSKAELVIEGFLKDEYKELLGQGKDESKPDSAEEKNKAILEKYPTPNDFIIGSLNQKGFTTQKLFDNIKKFYNVDDKTAKDLLDSALKNRKPTVKPTVYVDPTKNAPTKRPTGGYMFDSDEEEKEMDDWDKKYGATHNEDGSPKFKQV